MAKNDLDAKLEGLSTTEARHLLQRVAREVPEARIALTDWLLPARSDLLPHIVQMRHRLSCYVDWRDAGGVADEIDRLLDRASGLPAVQQWSAVSELAETLLDNLDNVQDEGEVYSTAERACGLLVEVARASRREADALERLLELEEGPYGEIPWAAAETLVGATPSLRDQLEGWLVQAYEAADPSTSGYRHLTLGRRLKDLYLASGRDADYLALLEAELGRPETYLEWSRYLDSRGRRDEAPRSRA